MPAKSPILESLAETRPSSYADQVYGRILHDILNGIFQPGARLPTENELAERFGVSRPVVREALARQRVDGHGGARRGSGPDVLCRAAHQLPNLADLEDISRFLRYQELRFYVEGQAAALAAERRTEKQLAAILEAHEAFAHEVGRGSFLPESDRRFHLAIC